MENSWRHVLPGAVSKILIHVKTRKQFISARFIKGNEKEEGACARRNEKEEGARGRPEQSDNCKKLLQAQRNYGERKLRDLIRKLNGSTGRYVLRKGSLRP